ncbi:MAG: class I SAM-dependent methyltransferase, partial [Planctomycetota bacterium]
MEEKLKLEAACAFGLEAVVKRELIDLGYEPTITQPGRVAFAGDWTAVARCNTWLRVADRVLIQVQKFSAPDFDALFDSVKEFEWASWLPADCKFPVTGRTRNSKLTSLPAIQRSVKRALVESLRRGHGRQELPESAAIYKVEVAMLDDVATLTIDTTGSSLHKRGYRTLNAIAPIKETLAAAMINLSVWNSDRPFWDPFCGSGTIAIEAALTGLRIAPGISRKFACSDWPEIESRIWRETSVEANDRRIRKLDLQILATDQDEQVLKLARRHANQAGVDEFIHFQKKTFREIRSKREYGCIITNPPYGERLDEQRSLKGLYESIPEVMQRLPSWSLYLITNMPRFEKLVQRKATRRRKLFNGRIECTYFQFLGPKPPGHQKDGSNKSRVAFQGGQQDRSIVKQNRTAQPSPSQDKHESHRQAQGKKPELNQPVFGGLTAKDREQAELFSNRLSKRARHLRRWPEKRGIGCFRLYERDIPEIPLVVDRYENHLHMTEYERPHDRDIARHAGWLELMVRTASATLEIPIHHVHLKKRRKSSESGQYGKLDSKRRFIQVKEGGLDLLVNLTDYVDTGLFLDHRITRKMIRDQAAGKNFLNLFGYTGSFT